MTFEFSANYAEEDDGPAVVLKISSEAFELNVALRISEIARLDDVLATPWQGGALRLGTSAGAPAWWSCDDGQVAICVGRDDQTWDFSIAFPVAELATLRASIDSELAYWKKQ